MGTRKNARFLSSTEREDFVRACVLMKADIVNPGAPSAAQYSKWDEFAAIHTMIVDAFGPGEPAVNFAHGGPGAYSFLSWHRYFLYRLELELQSHVPGVMIPYWDWTDPASIMTDTFMGPDGNPGAGNVVQQGYFAFDRPGNGTNATPLPGWWPAGLDGWRCPAAFPPTLQGGLRRNVENVSLLPSTNDVQELLAMAGYHGFQAALEEGAGISSGHRMHNDMHRWFGIGSHVRSGSAPAFDPFFYLIHTNVDRLWAMWQMDGHENTYPNSGGDPHHHRNDLMYPWTGGAAGYGTNAGISAAIPMPDFGALGPIRNVDTLDFRNAFGYTYDTLPIIGIGLDRTGSMNGMTPDPMVSTDPDVTKWEAAKRGVSAFLQDCETVQDSGITYVMAGIKTFMRTGGSNSFTPVFGGPDYGLIKNGTPFSKDTFDANIAAVSPVGLTPLAEALLDVQDTLVEPPFGGDPDDEQRYLAMLTDGILTAGAPMNSIPDGSFDRTAIFAMGFGTGLDVDYATLADMVAKGQPLSTQQIFQGEDAGTIDKFYSNALASAIGFTTVIDPVIELFAGEHTHVDFMATSAEDVFFITAQGMDFRNENWTFLLHGPGGQVFYGEDPGHQHHDTCQHCCPRPHVTATRSNGRLSVVVQRGNASRDCWVGDWQLMIAYKARLMDKMMMPEIGKWLFPVSAGPVRGERYARLLIDPKLRKATRNVVRPSLHGLDVMPIGTNSNTREACNAVVNIYARTNLRLELQTDSFLREPGEELSIAVHVDAPFGKVQNHRAFARLISPAFDILDLIPEEKLKDLLQKESERYSSKKDPALILAEIEKKKELTFIKDEEVKVVSHDNGPFHIHVKNTEIPGIYHLGVYVEGTYFPGHVSDPGKGGHDHHHAEKASPGEMPEGKPEPFIRLLNISSAITKKER